jgi:hypothetical protein
MLVLIFSLLPLFGCGMRGGAAMRNARPYIPGAIQHAIVRHSTDIHAKYGRDGERDSEGRPSLCLND